MKARIATFAMINSSHWGQDAREIEKFVFELVDSVRSSHPDLVCLPEAFLATGGDRASWREMFERTLTGLRERAKEMHCYLLANLAEPSEKYPDCKYNTAFLIGRDGEIVGKYRKLHTTKDESEVSHVIPGAELPIFDTDIGRIGIQTCFDIGWRDTWMELGRRGADLVIWNSAYEGGNLLNAYAALNMYYVVSTVRTNYARIIDKTGREVVRSSCWNELAMADIDTETTVFHIDNQFQKINAIRSALGDKVTIQTYHDENIFTIESNDPAWPMERIKKEFGLMSYADYHAEATLAQEAYKKAHLE